MAVIFGYKPMKKVRAGMLSDTSLYNVNGTKAVLTQFPIIRETLVPLGGRAFVVVDANTILIDGNEGNYDGLILAGSQSTSPPANAVVMGDYEWQDGTLGSIAGLKTYFKFPVNAITHGRIWCYTYQPELGDAKVGDPIYTGVDGTCCTSVAYGQGPTSWTFAGGYIDREHERAKDVDTFGLYLGNLIEVQLTQDIKPNPEIKKVTSITVALDQPGQYNRNVPVKFNVTTLPNDATFREYGIDISGGGATITNRTLDGFEASFNTTGVKILTVSTTDGSFLSSSAAVNII